MKTSGDSCAFLGHCRRGRNHGNEEEGLLNKRRSVLVSNASPSPPARRVVPWILGLGRAGERRCEQSSPPATGCFPSLDRVRCLDFLFRFRFFFVVITFAMASDNLQHKCNSSHVRIQSTRQHSFTWGNLLFFRRRLWF